MPSQVSISLEAETLEKVHRLLAESPEKMATAMGSTIRRVRSHVRSHSADEIVKEYAITKKDVRAEQNVKVRDKKTPGEYAAEILYSGAKIPLSRFDVQPKTDVRRDYRVPVYFARQGHTGMVKPGVRVKARQLRDNPMTPFENAFVAVMKSGHVGVFQRNTASGRYDGRLPISGDKGKGGQFLGSSVAQMLDREEVKESIAADAQENFNKNMSYEVDRVLKGYGL
jgi:hypothetical protein